MKWLLLVFCTLCSFSLYADHSRNGKKPIPVSLQLLWKNQFQFAGYYMAKEKGFYKEVGLDVDIREFDNSTDLVGDVLSGKSDFAVGRSSLMIDKAAGKDIVALFAAFQQSPLMLLSKADSNINSPNDLKDKRIMMTQDAEQVAEVLAMLLQAGLRDSDYEHQSHSFNLQDLIDDKTDAMGSYVSNEPYQLQQQGIPYTIIHPADYGFDMYADILFTSRRMVNERPSITHRFYEASIRGWRYAFDHIQETAALIHAQYNSQQRSVDALEFEGRALKALAFDDQGQFGTLSQKKFEGIAKLYLITGVLEPNYDIRDFIYQPEGLMLSLRERQYLSRLNNITVCAYTDWMPYEGITDNLYQGLVADYMTLLAEKLNVTLTVMPTDSAAQTLNMMRSGLCDLVPAAMATPKGGRHLAFSTPYLSMPAVVAVHDRSVYEETSEELGDKRLAVRVDSVFLEILRNRYPNATILPVNTVSEGLKRVETQDVFGFIDAPASISHTLQKEHMLGITLYDTLNDQWDISVAVRRDNQVLLDVFNHAIANLSPREHNSTANQWLNINYAYKVDYTHIWLIGTAFGLLILLIAYRYKVVANYNTRLKFMAQHDPLTGIYNRNKLYEYLNNELRLYQRYQRHFAVIFFDVDDFKRVNDSYGHNEGDRALSQLASIVNQELRETDHFGRWGGEEFLIVLPEARLATALLIAEKLRQAIASYDFRFDNHPITCSFGIAEVQEGDTIESLIHRADEALYFAKSEGKNCTRCAQSSAESA